MTLEEQQHADYKNIIISIFFACLGYALFNVGDAALKEIGHKFHFSQIFFVMGFFITLSMALYGWKKEGKKAFRTKKPKLMFFRAISAQICGLCNIAALPNIPLTTFYTLVFTAPFWVAILAAFFLKDELGWRRLFLILLGFSVILFIFRPGGGMFNIWSAIVLFSAFVYAGQMIMVRHIGTGESKYFMIMCGSVMSLFLSVPFLATHYIEPSLYDWFVFAVMGCFGAFGLLCVSHAFQIAPSASVVAPYHYTQIIWGALLGYFIFSEIPSMETIIGATLIVFLGMFLLYTETRRRKSLKVQDI